MKLSLKVALVGALSLALAMPAWVSAQFPFGTADYPMLGGGPGRQGRNIATQTSGPGRANLRWFTPNATDGRAQTLLRNNTYNDGNANIIEGSFIAADEATDTFDAAPSGSANLDDLQGESDVPSYYTSLISNAQRGNPTVRDGGGTRNIFEWRFDPGFLDPARNVPGNYALFAWIPQGPTTVNGVRRFSARYYVYEILYGNGQRFVDIVDTFAGGRGWVRLGSGGRSGNVLFNYNGITPIRIRLINTNPRNLNVEPPVGDPDADLMNDPEAIVYADAAMAVPDYGNHVGMPVITRINLNIGQENRVVSAANRPIVRANGDEAPIVQSQGVVRSHVIDSALLRWAWSPTDTTQGSRTLDNTTLGVTNSGFSSSIASGRFQGTDYFQSATVTAGTSFPTVRYQPTLATGSYQIYVYVGGDANGQSFNQNQRWEIRSGGNTEVVEVDMSQGPGWVKIGTSDFYPHESSVTGDPLEVFATAFSSEAGDATRLSYADAVRFVGDNNLAVNSTPIQVNAQIRLTNGGAPTNKSVVIVAAEDGRLYCLDAEGRPDGTTTVYWTYPSLPDPDNNSWTDPNHVLGEDGPGGQAQMPTGFDTSSAFIERINGLDYMFIAATNGRVYCIEVAGRGDFDSASGKPGTTRRRWTFPDDYPSLAKPSSLGQFRGSLAFHRTFAGTTVIVPTTQGRIYALEALGSDASKTTTVRWTFPALDQPTLGEIWQTPAVAFDRVYFGTRRKNEAPGQFYALNAVNGNVLWSKSNLPDATAQDYLGGPAVTSPAVGAGVSVVYTANENGRVYAWDALTGANYWSTSEDLGSGSSAPLTTTRMTAFNQVGGFTPFGVLMVPTNDGRLVGLFTDAATLNVNGTRRAWQYVTEGESATGGIAVGQNWMFAVDSAGYMYGFNDGTGIIGGVIAPGDDIPGEQTVVENDPSGRLYRFAKVVAIPKETYLQLRDNPTTYSRAQALAGSQNTDLAFEWGETVYLMAYDFQYEADQIPVVNFAIGTQGGGTRQNPAEARRFAGPFDNVPGSGAPPVVADGYAIYAFTIQGGGSSALAPGDGKISATITATLGAGDRRQVGALATPLSFAVANPLAIYMAPAGANPNALIAANNPLSIGYSNDPRNDQNRQNGSGDVASTGHREDLLLASVGQAANGQTGVTQVFVADRSLLTLIRGPGRGLDGVRLERRDLEWQGGATAVLNPLNALLFPGFEDLPARFPNDSLDYPNVRRDQVRVVRELFGSSENPALRSVALNPPLDQGGNDLDDETEAANRRIRSTVFDFDVEFPRFQPANLSTSPNSQLTNLPAGYLGRFSVFVDSNQNGQLDLTSNRREAFRSFRLGGQVVPDLRMSIGTPTIDLGSLAAGAGYDPLLPALGGSSFSPWNAAKDAENPVWGGLFRSLVVNNEGNVNLLNVRLAKGTNSGSNYQAWPIFAPGNDELAWLDSSVNVWTDFDANTKFNLGYPAIIQKSRPGDRLPTTLLTNPIRRANPTLNVPTDAQLIPNGPEPASPRIGVTVPLGFPVGTYSQNLRVIEDSLGDDQSLGYSGGVAQEVMADPSFNLIFKVRETRMTNSVTRQPNSGNPMTFPLMDDMVPAGVVPPFTYSNLHPAATRDLKGDMLVAMVSNRPLWTQPLPTAQPSNSWRIFMAGLDGNIPGAVNDGAGASPLRDLHRFNPTAQRWFRHEASYPNGYPFGPTETNAGAANALFGAAGTASDYIIGTQSGQQDTVRFGSPALPSAGFVNPIDGSTYSSIDMAFLGEAQRQAGAERVGVSRLFVAPISLAADGTVTVGAPIGANVDPSMAKGKPSVIQIGSTTFVVFVGSSNGQSNAYVVPFNRGAGTFGRPTTLRLGLNFETMGTPSFTVRQIGSSTVAEFVISGKLAGRNASEVFIGRLPLGGSLGQPLNLGVRTERLEADREPGTFRSRGLRWNTNLTLSVQTPAGITNLEVAGTRQTDPNGVISFDTRLGGKAYLDPVTGSVRLARGVVPTNAALLLTYQPRLQRLSENPTGSYGGGVLLYDQRPAYRPSGDGQYWARNNNTGVTDSDLPPVTRFIAIYNRAASGNGLTSRPYMKTLRIGAQLPTPIHTQPNGNITGITVTGANGFYQVDPANGRVYFTAADEGRTLNISYTGTDANGNPVAIASQPYVVDLIEEREEAPLPIEQAVNEGSFTAFLDPIVGTPRPGLIWIVFSSTRAGSPDLYFQTIAPRFNPVPIGR